MRNIIKTRNSRLVVLAAVAALAAPAMVMAQSTWVGASANWSNGGSWSGGTPVSGATTTLTFGLGGAYTATNDIANPFTLKALTFSNTGAVGLAGGALTFAGTAPSITQSSSGAVTIANDINLLTNLTVGGTGTGAMNLTGSINGFDGTNYFGVAKTGNFGLNLSGATVNVNNLAFNGGTNSITGGVYTTNSRTNPGINTPATASTAVALSVGNVSGTTTVLNVSGGAQMTNGNTYIGNFSGATATLNVSGAGTTIGTLDLTAPGAYRFGVYAGNGTINITSGAVVTSVLSEMGRAAGANATLNVDNATYNVEQLVCNRGYIAGVTAGILSTYTVTVGNGGVLHGAAGGVGSGLISVGSGFGSSGTFTVNNGGTVNADSNLQLADGAGSSTIFTVNNGGIVNVGGNFFSAAARLNASTTTTATINVNAGGQLNITGTAVLSGGSQTQSGTTTMNVAGGTLAISGGLNMGQDSFGAATINVSSGGTATVGGSTLLAIFNGNTTTSGTINLTGASSFHGTGAIFMGVNGGTVAGTGTINVSGGSTFLTDDDLLAAKGSVTLNDTSTLTASGISNQGILPGAPVTLNGTSVLNISGAVPSDVNLYAGVISGTGSIVITQADANASCTQYLTGASTYTGTSTLKGGFVLLGNSVLSNTASPLGKATSAVALNPDAGNFVNMGFYANTPGGGSFTFSRPITVSGAGSSVISYQVLGTDTFTGGTATFSGAITLNSNVEFFTAGGDIAVTGAVTGVGGVNVAGSGSTVSYNGSVLFSGTQKTYSGTTFVSSGTLGLESANVLLSTAVIANGSLGADPVGVPPGGLQVDANNTVSRVVNTSDGTNTFLGLTAVSGAKLTVNGSASTLAANGLTVAQGALMITSGATIAQTGAVQLATQETLSAGLFNGTRSKLPSVAILGGISIGGENGLFIENDGGALGARSYYGGLDVTTNDIIVQGSAADVAATVARLSDMARVGQAGAGLGLFSSVADADTNANKLRYAVAVVSNDLGGSPLFDTFDGVSVGLTDVLVKFTYWGDADLNGMIDDTDFFLINNGYGNNLTGWVNGDFDYSGVVDDTDFFLINNAYGQQGGTLRAGGAVPEPTGMGVLALGAGALMGRRRRA